MTNIRLVYADGTEGPARAIAEKIQAALDSNQRVLWLVSGGSAIAVAVRARQLLGQLRTDGRLTVAMVDERFVPIGHPDSNWNQLLQNGFDKEGVQSYPMLEVGVNPETVVTTYDSLLKDLLAAADYRIGLFGVGADGHTGGLLPHNPLMKSDKLIGHFKGPDYERITVTPTLIKKLDDKFAFVLGEQKWPSIALLLKKGSANEIPARVLAKNGNITIFTDYKGENT